MTTAWTKAERDELLRAEETRRQVCRTTDEDDDMAHERLRLEGDRLHRAYWDGVPRLPLSACPRCGQILHKAFDPWGIEGWFWQEKMGEDDLVEPPSCPHFAVLLGAVNLNGLPPRGGRYRAHLGPEVPYVIPRVLSLPGMAAVISTVPLENGYTTYPIAYFAEPLPKPFYLTSPWTRTTFNFTNDAGESRWTYKNDPWDFELEPWIAKGLLHWITPGDPSLRVVSTPAPCPYVGLTGRRQPIEIEGDRLYPISVPDGRDLGDPFE